MKGQRNWWEILTLVSKAFISSEIGKTNMVQESIALYYHNSLFKLLKKSTSICIHTFLLQRIRKIRYEFWPISFWTSNVSIIRCLFEVIA